MSYKSEQELEQELAKLLAEAEEGDEAVASELEEAEDQDQKEPGEQEGQDDKRESTARSADEQVKPDDAEVNKPPKVVPLAALKEAREINKRLYERIDTLEKERQERSKYALPDDPDQLNDLMLDATGETAHKMRQEYLSIEQRVEARMREAVERISLNSAQRAHDDFWDVMNELTEAEQANPALAERLFQIRHTSEDPMEDLYQYGLSVLAADPTRAADYIEREVERRTQEKLKEQLKGIKTGGRVPSPSTGPSAPPEQKQPLTLTRDTLLGRSQAELERLAEED